MFFIYLYTQIYILCYKGNVANLVLKSASNPLNEDKST